MQTRNCYSTSVLNIPANYSPKISSAKTASSLPLLLQCNIASLGLKESFRGCAKQSSNQRQLNVKICVWTASLKWQRCITSWQRALYPKWARGYSTL